MSTTLKYIKLSDLLEKYSTHIDLIKNKYLNLLSDLTEVTDLSSEIFINNINAIHKMGTIIICYKETPLSDKFDIVASGTIIIEPKLIHGGKSVGHIEDIVTNCNYRGKGVAKDILDFLIQEGREKNCYKIILDCVEKLESFYSKNGFKKKGVQMSLYF
jgi:glucosamine-phosphate N-acetyltransferase